MRTISFIRVEFFYVEMALIEETFRDIIVRMLHLVLVGAVRSTRSSIFYLVANLSAFAPLSALDSQIGSESGFGENFFRAVFGFEEDACEKKSSQSKNIVKFT